MNSCKDQNGKNLKRHLAIDQINKNIVEKQNRGMEERCPHKRELFNSPDHADTRYSGDKFFVQKPEDKSVSVKSVNSFGKRSTVICRKMLEIICYGGTVTSPSVTIDDTNRKGYFELLMALYRTERKYIDERRREGIFTSASKGNYKGRKRIRIDKLASEEIFLDYEERRISSTEIRNK